MNGIVNHHFESRIQRTFFEIRPIQELLSLLNLNEYKYYLSDVEAQRRLVQQTVAHVHCAAFSPSTKFCEKFMKTVIETIEENKWEACDELYNAFGRLLQSSHATAIYRTYHLHGKWLTVAEEDSLVKDGTTGLRTWDCGKVLTQYCLENRNLFNQKVVVELGSGIGLTGISVCSICKPAKYIFCDCHQQVLHTLLTNVWLNADHGSASAQSTSKCQCLPCTNINGTCIQPKFNSPLTDVTPEIGVLELDINDIGSVWRHLEAVPVPDVILVSDLTYDPELIASLMKAFDWLLLTFPRCIIYLCTQLRNQSTHQQLIDYISAKSWKTEAVFCQEELGFNLSHPHCPVYIYKVHNTNKS